MSATSKYAIDEKRTLIIKKITPSLSSYAPIRRLHKFLHYKGSLFLFGGLKTGDQYCVDSADDGLYEYRIASKKWRLIKGSGDIPTQRIAHCMALDPIREKLIVFFGRYRRDCYADFFEFCLIERKWTRHNIKKKHKITPDIKKSSSNVCFIRNNCAYIFGGFDYEVGYLSELWKLDLKTKEYCEIPYSSSIGKVKQENGIVLFQKTPEPFRFSKTKELTEQFEKFELGNLVHKAMKKSTSFSSRNEDDFESFFKEKIELKKSFLKNRHLYNDDKIIFFGGIEKYRCTNRIYVYDMKSNIVNYLKSPTIECKRLPSMGVAGFQISDNESIVIGGALDYFDNQNAKINDIKMEKDGYEDEITYFKVVDNVKRKPSNVPVIVSSKGIGKFEETRAFHTITKIRYNKWMMYGGRTVIKKSGDNGMFEITLKNSVEFKTDEYNLFNLFEEKVLCDLVIQLPRDNSEIYCHKSIVSQCEFFEKKIKAILKNNVDDEEEEGSDNEDENFRFKMVLKNVEEDVCMYVIKWLYLNHSEKISVVEDDTIINELSVFDIPKVYKLAMECNIISLMNFLGQKLLRNMAVSECLIVLRKVKELFGKKSNFLVWNCMKFLKMYYNVVLNEMKDEFDEFNEEFKDNLSSVVLEDYSLSSKMIERMLDNKETKKNSLSNHLKQLYFSKKDWNITIISSDETKFKAHKEILAVNSNYFRVLFASNFVESRQLVIKENIPAYYIDYIILYCYTKTKVSIQLSDSSGLYVVDQKTNEKKMKMPIEKVVQLALYSNEKLFTSLEKFLIDEVLSFYSKGTKPFLDEKCKDLFLLDKFAFLYKKKMFELEIKT